MEITLEAIHLSNSSLATYIDTGTGNYNTRKYAITRITVHHAAGVCSMQNFSSILRSGRKVSWNYAIDTNGKIGLFVEENHRAWTSSNANNDHRAITIEVSNSKTGGNWPVSDAAFSSLVKLCTDICIRNNIKKLSYTGSLSGSNVTLHQWFASTACPGPYLKSKIPELVSKVNVNLGNPSSLNYTPNNSNTAYTAAINGSNLLPISSLNINKLTPYIITIDRHSPDINYQKMSKIGVIGTFIEAGYLYNNNHKIVNVYQNPKLDKQVLAANKANMPFGLFADVRSHSVNEAKKELQELSLCVRKCPPKLGVWLKLNMTSNTNINNSIIDQYQSTMVNELGLKNQIGFYVSRSQLKQINWSKYCNDWYLWIVDHLSSLDGLDELLTPTLFDV